MIKGINKSPDHEAQDASHALMSIGTSDHDAFGDAMNAQLGSRPKPVVADKSSDENADAKASANKTADAASDNKAADAASADGKASPKRRADSDDASAKSAPTANTNVVAAAGVVANPAPPVTIKDIAAALLNTGATVETSGTNFESATAQALAGKGDDAEKGDVADKLAAAVAHIADTAQPSAATASAALVKNATDSMSANLVALLGNAKVGAAKSEKLSATATPLLKASSVADSSTAETITSSAVNRASLSDFSSAHLPNELSAVAEDERKPSVDDDSAAEVSGKATTKTQSHTDAESAKTDFAAGSEKASELTAGSDAPVKDSSLDNISVSAPSVSNRPQVDDDNLLAGGNFSVNGNDASIEVKLPTLGTTMMNVSVQNGVADLRVDQRTAAYLDLRNEDLKTSLQQEGLKLGRISVDLPATAVAPVSATTAAAHTASYGDTQQRFGGQSQSQSQSDGADRQDSGADFVPAVGTSVANTSVANQTTSQARSIGNTAGRIHVKA